MPLHSRRAVLRAAALATAGALAGCPGGDVTDTPSTPTGTGTETDRPTGTGIATDPPAPTPTPTTTDEPTATPEPRVGGGPGPQPDAAWPLQNRGPANGAYNTDGAAFTDPPSRAWRVTATLPPEEPEYDAVLEQPVVADRRLYAANVVRRGPMQPLPGRQLLLAADAATGEKLWTHEIVDENEGVERPVTPAVGDDAVLFGAGERVRALDRADGAVVWTRTLPDDLDAVYATGERSYAVVAGTLHALDATGGTAWTADTDESVGTLPARGPERLYLATGTGRLSALDPATGEVAWTETFERDEDSVSTGYGVLAAARGVFVRTDGDVVAFADDGSRVWRVDGYVTGLATDGRTLYGGTRSGIVRALDATTGEEVREVDPDGVLRVSDGPVLADGVLYLVGDGDRLLAVRTDDGSTLWSAAVPLSGLALAGDTLYGSENGGTSGLVALR